MKKRNWIIFFVFIYLVTVSFSLKDMTGKAFSGNHLTALCLESGLPSLNLEAASLKTETTVETTEKKVVSKENPSKKQIEKRNQKPKVLIYHTHATESYLPSSAGNFHRTAVENTVRDAGNVLEKTLENEGIGVIHDKTLHDNPSYNDSYSRSFETVKALMEKYPSIECIIDLHRDATPAEIAGPVEKVKGKERAVYSYVLSSTCETAAENRAFLGALNKTALSRYDGYTGRILERPYWYNQELSEKAVLIEMGNNRNNIKEVRSCAAIFGKILAETLKGSD